MLENVVPTSTSVRIQSNTSRSHGSLDADIIIKNAPDPVFVSDLEGKIPVRITSSISKKVGASAARCLVFFYLAVVAAGIGTFCLVKPGQGH